MNEKSRSGDIIWAAMNLSTFHGMNRITGANSRGIRLLWCILVISSFTAFTMHISNQISSYFEYNVVTLYSPRGIPFDFPDVHLCHEIPISQSYFLQAKEMAKVKGHPLGMVLSKLDSLGIIESQIKDGLKKSKIASSIRKGILFWETIDWNNFFKHIGHRNYQTITRALFNNERIELSPIQYFTYDRNHILCSKIEVNQSRNAHLSDMIRISVFLEDEHNPDYQSFLEKIGYIQDSSQELRLYFTERNKYPTLESNYLNIHSGRRYKIGLRKVKRVLYNSVNRPCFRELPTFTSPFSSSDKIVMNDLYQACVDEHFQEMLVKKCGCYVMSMSNALLSYYVKTSFPMCLNTTGIHNDAPEKIKLLSSRARCFKSVVDHYYDTFSEICRPRMPCNNTVYTFTTTYSNKWPVPQTKERVIRNVVMTPYKEAQQKGLPVPGWESFLNNSNYKEKFESHFSEILIRPQEIFGSLEEEEPHYPLFNLLSDVGGCMGLYMGVSVLTISELVELFYHLIRKKSIKQE